MSGLFSLTELSIKRGGGKPVRRWYTVAPSEYISLLGVAFPSHCSGDTYPSVPRLSSLKGRLPPDIIAIPKSMRITFFIFFSEHYI